MTGLDERHDDRIRRALHDAARVPEVHDVPSGVARKRAARHARRRAATIGVAIVLVAGVGGTLAAVIDNDRGPRVTAGPARNTGLVRVADGAFGGAATGGTSVGAQPLTLDPDVGYVRGPVFASHGEVTVAAYERADNSFGFPPSHLVTFSLSDGRVTRRVDLKAEIQSIAEGEGARWAVTKNADVPGRPTEWFLKRIAPDGTPKSTPIPVSEQVSGAVAAAGGGVWLPVRDGVLRFDPATGDLAGKVRLDTPTDHRSVAGIGKAAWVTDGATLRRLDPSTDTTVESRAVDTGGTAVVALASTSDAAWALTTPGADGRVRVVRVDVTRFLKSAPGSPDDVLTLPSGLAPTDLGSADDRVWLVALDRFILLDTAPGGAPRARETVFVDAADVALTWPAGDVVLVTAAGQLSRVPLTR